MRLSARRASSHGAPSSSSFWIVRNAAAGIGLPKVTENLPGRGGSARRLQTASVPRIKTGTTGTLSSRAKSPVPGYTVVLFAPVYAMFVLVVFTTLNQIQGDLLLLAGVGCLVLAPLVYLWRARDFLRPHTADESATLVRGVRRQAYLFNAAGTAIVVLFLLDLDTVSALQVMEFVVTAGGGVLLTTVVAADLVLGLLRLEHGQAKGFVGSDLATAFEEKLAALEGTGLGR